MAGGAEGTGGIDPDQENGARTRTAGGVDALTGAQNDGLKAIEREQTSLKWGSEAGPTAICGKYKSLLDATSTNLDTRITQLREMLKNSETQVANYEENDAEIAESFRKAASGLGGGPDYSPTTTPPMATGTSSAPETSSSASSGYSASASSSSSSSGSSSGGGYTLVPGQSQFVPRGSVS